MFFFNENSGPEILKWSDFGFLQTTVIEGFQAVIVGTTLGGDPCAETKG